METILEELGCIFIKFSRQNTQLFNKLSTGEAESGRSKGGCNFGKIPPSMYQTVKEWKFVFFYWKNLSNLFEFNYLEPCFYPSITDFTEAVKILKQKNYSHKKICGSV